MAMAGGSWSETTPFPFIQGSDCCGRVIAVAPGEDESLGDQRVLVRSFMYVAGWFRFARQCLARTGFQRHLRPTSQSAHQRGICGELWMK